MKLSIVPLLLLCAALVSPLQAQPQIILQALNGEEVLRNDSLFLYSFAGESNTQRLFVLRNSMNVDTVTISAVDAPFAASTSELVFDVTDTAVVDFSFTPVTEGTVTTTVTFTASGQQTVLTLVGVATTVEPSTARFMIDLEGVDLGILQDDNTAEGEFTITNNTDNVLTLSWQAPDPKFEYYVDGVQTTTAVIAAKSSTDVRIVGLGSQMDIGVHNTVIYVGDGADVDPAMPGVTSIPVYITCQKESSANGPLLIQPTSVLLYRDGEQTNAYEEATVVIRNISAADAVISAVELETTPSEIYANGPNPALPYTLPAGAALTWTVGCTATDAGPYSNTLVISGAGMVYGRVPISTIDSTREQAPPIKVMMETNDAKLGETTTATFKNVSELPDVVDHGIVTLEYNTTVLVPVTETLDANDPVVDGMRTSRFVITPSGHGSGDVCGSVVFTVVLGNSSESPLNVVAVDWRTEDDVSIGRSTEVNGTVVSVLDAEGYELNAQPGPLSLRVSPMPVRDHAQISYTIGEGGFGMLRLYDRMGTLIADYTDQLSGPDGSVTLSAGALATGTYFVQLSNGVYTVVSMILIE